VLVVEGLSVPEHPSVLEPIVYVIGISSVKVRNIFGNEILFSTTALADV